MSENDNKKGKLQGVWRTVKGRHIFIKDGQNLTDAMKESGKFGTKKKLARQKLASTIKKIADSKAEKMAAELVMILGKEFNGVKGQSAIEKLLIEQQGHVKGAFSREDIGNVDLLWGNDKLGLMHILKRRNEQGIDITEFIKDITEVVENGEFIKKNERGNFEFWYNKKMAVISPELYGNKITYLLTAFKKSKK